MIPNDVIGGTQVDIMLSLETRDSVGDIVRTFRKINSFPCTLTTPSTKDETNFYLRGVRASHKILFGVDPGEINQLHRLKIGNVWLRPVGKVVGVQQMGLIWHLFADEYTDDNQNQEVKPLS